VIARSSSTSAAPLSSPSSRATWSGTSGRVSDWQILHPKAIEEHFGITLGHIHHVDNGFGFADRVPHKTPIAGLYSASAGTHPAGSVIGCAGYLAASLCLRELGVSPPA
jgi:phytoene dehydrogenase-like protein